MLYTNLGRTALRVSRLCLGTVNFGGRVDEPDGHAIMSRALDHGINFLDTADIYGWRVHKGYTEESIGRWFAEAAGRRDSVILATKVGSPMTEGLNDRGLSARHIIASCEQSLRRLQTDWIDLYQMHQPDPNASWDEVWQAFDTLITHGKVRYAGSSNFAGWHIASAQNVAAHRNMLGIFSEQCIYNLITRHAELEVIPAAQAHGIAVLPWSPLHGGLLASVLANLQNGTARKSAQGRAAEALKDHGQTIAEYEKACGEMEPAVAALTWVLSRPGVTAPVIGPRTVDQLSTALRALEIQLASDDIERLDKLFPPVGKGGLGPGSRSRMTLTRQPGSMIPGTRRPCSRRPPDRSA